MKPKNKTTNCLPTSSNCIVWEGPNINCINLCKGDTITDVVYKLAILICDLKDKLDLTDLDLSCLVENCQLCDEPNKALSNVLTLLINKVCTLEDAIAALEPGGEGNSYTEPILNLPSCLQYVNNQGQTVTQLIHNQFSLTLATKICQLNSTVTSNTNTINNHETRITALENQSPVSIPQITPNCVLPKTPQDIDDVVFELEKKYCELQTTLGSNIQLLDAAGKQCLNLGQQNAFSIPGTISSINGWKNVISNFSDSINNLWITVCDLRAGIAALKDCCSAGVGNCLDFILGFTAAANNTRDTVTLFLAGLTNIPAGYGDCTQLGSLVRITDTTGNVYTSYINLVNASTDVDGVAFDISNSNLNTSQTYTITIQACIKNEQNNTCSKTTTITLVPPCSIVTGLTATLS